MKHGQEQEQMRNQKYRDDYVPDEQPSDVAEDVSGRGDRHASVGTGDGDSPDTGRERKGQRPGSVDPKEASKSGDKRSSPDADALFGEDDDQQKFDGVGRGQSGKLRDPLSHKNKGIGRTGQGSGADDVVGNGAGSDAGKSKGWQNPLKGAGSSMKNGAKSFGEGAKTAFFGGAGKLAQGISDGVVNFGVGVKAVVGNGVGKLARGLGVSQRTAGILAAVVTFSTVTGGVAGVSTYVQEQNMLGHEMVLEDDCGEDIASAQGISEAAIGDEQQDANAAKAWAVFKALGLTDEQAAGAIGNMVGEGGLSPYTMECDFITAPNEKWGIGPIKQGFLADLNSWTLNQVFPYYHNISLNKDFYNTSRHGYVAGVGMFGFTGMHYDALEDWAAGMGLKWYDAEKAFDIQMSFIIAPGASGGYGGPGGASEWLSKWGNDTSGCGTPESAAEVFCLKFEGNRYIASAKLTAARAYYDKFKGTTGDASYANSIIQLAGTTQAGAAGGAASKEAEDCGVKAGVYDNSDLARAAVAYAYKTRDEGIGNDGTELYQALHRAIFPGDTYFQSCDRSVATAVRWAGADNSFPAGATGTQLAHCQDNPDKWEYIGTGVATQDANNFLPGDVVVCNGHIVMYVGNETIKEKYPDASDSVDFVSGSIGGPPRSPGCTGDNFHSDSRPYEVFRLKKYEDNNPYKDVVAGQNLNDR